MEAPYMSLEEYLEFEAVAESKHEYWGGRIVALAGTSPAHGQIVMNVSAELHGQLKERGCRVVTSDQRVRISASRYVYPDISVTCSPEYDEKRHPVTLLNPDLLVEVSSESTSESDRGAKLSAYIEIPSLKEYWIISQSGALVVQHVRREAMWEVRALKGKEGTIRSEHLRVEVSMSDVYALVSNVT